MFAIYDPITLDRLANVVKYTSIIWKKRFYDVGDFEIHLPANTPYPQYLKQCNIISHQGNHGFVLYVKQVRDEIIIHGLDLKGLLYRKQVIPPFIYMTTPGTIHSHDRISGPAETVIKHYASTQAVSPTDIKRKIANLIIAPDTGKGPNVAWQAKFARVSDELAKIGAYAKMGYDIKMVTDGGKQLVFDIVTGIDRTAGQHIVPPVIFCTEYRNIGDFEYILDADNEVNVAYVGGNGEEEQQYITKLYSGDTESAGIYRAEGFTSVSSNDVIEVDDGGKAYLEENKAKESMEAESNDRLKYKTDWFLGDYVTVRLKILGEMLSVDKQITEVQEVYERNNFKVIPTFGDKENIIKKLLKNI